MAIKQIDPNPLQHALATLDLLNIEFNKNIEEGERRLAANLKAIDESLPKLRAAHERAVEKQIERDKADAERISAPGFKLYEFKSEYD